MKFTHVNQAVYFSRWAITEPGWYAVHEIVQKHQGEAITLSVSENVDMFGNPLPEYELTDEGVAIIPIKGTLIHHASLLEKQCGACSYDDIKRDVSRAINEGAQKIVLDIDSPGGMCMGCAETSRVIARATEFCRVEAVTDSLMCSGGYWLGSQADAIYVTQTAEVGSIGVITAFMDQSERYKMAGVKPVVFTSGDLKGAGFPGTSLSEAQAENIKKDVAHYFGMFKEAVLKNRLVEDDSMRGQSFTGDQAYERGLVDKIVEDIEECYSLES
jgi:signal peptide peptidase SppA